MTHEFAGLSFLERLDPANTEGLTASAGAPLAEGIEAASREAVIDAVSRVYDPEIPVNVYDLGLIYEIRIDGAGDVAIVMTLTAPSCPVAGEIPKMVAEAAADCPAVGRVVVTLTWEPPWTREMMSEDAALALGLSP